jgi:hypothetical protein
VSAPIPPTSDVATAHYVPGERFRDLGDGRRAAVSGERRLVLKEGGVTAIDVAPVDDLGRPHRIPDALGGGWLFVGEHTVCFARDYGGALTRIATMANTFEKTTVGIGYRSVLLGGNATPTLYELPSAKPIARSPPGLVELFGTSQGLVAALTSRGELYLSASAGAPWQKLDAPRVQSLGFDGKGIVADTDRGRFRLTLDGKLGPRPEEPGFVEDSNLDAFEDVFTYPFKPLEPSDAGRLTDVFTRRMTADTALALKGSDLLFLDGASGRTTQTVVGAFSGHENCFIVRGGVPSFVGCNEDEFRLFRVDAAGRAPVLELSIKGVDTADFGEPAPETPLAYPCRCDGRREKGASCLREGEGAWTNVAPPADPDGLLERVPWMVHIEASADGRVFEFGWLDGSNDLVIVDHGAGRVRRIPVGSLPAWAAGGIDWEALTIESGTLRFLISSGRARPGVIEIGGDDSVHAQLFDGQFSAVGSRALQLTSEGKLLETLDAGHTFHEVEPPPGGVPRPAVDDFGCREAGCILGPWYRAGWGGGAR